MTAIGFEKYHKSYFGNFDRIIYALQQNSAFNLNHRAYRDNHYV